MRWTGCSSTPAAPDEATETVIRTTGAILAGRRSYNVGRKAERRETSEPFGGRWTGPQFIITHDPPDDEEDPTITFLSGDIRDAVATALEAAEGKNLLVLGANVARQCLDEGLVDEILIQLMPVLLGDGVRLFGDPGSRRIDLETVDVTPLGPTDQSPVPRCQVATECAEPRSFTALLRDLGVCQAEVVLPARAVVGDLPTALDGLAVVTEGPCEAL